MQISTARSLHALYPITNGAESSGHIACGWGLAYYCGRLHHAYWSQARGIDRGATLLQPTLSAGLSGQGAPEKRYDSSSAMRLRPYPAQPPHRRLLRIGR